MPKVSPENLAQRQAQLLDAASLHFAQHGFVAPMSQLSQPRGRSTGRWYHAFASKDALITAVITQALTHVNARLITAITPTRSYPELIEAGLDTLEHVIDESLPVARLLPQIWAEALRRPEILQLVEQLDAPLVDALWAQLISFQEQSALEDGLDPTGLIPLSLATFQGFVLHQLLPAEPGSVQAHRAAVRRWLVPAALS